MLKHISSLMRPRRPSPRGLRRNDKGNVALFTAIALPVLMLSIGGAMDYSRVLAAKTKLQAAADSAALATYNHASTRTGITDAEMHDYYMNQLNISLRSHFEQQIAVRSVTLNYDKANGTLLADVKASFPTTFISLAGIPSMPLDVEAEVQAGVSYTEVALVLDVTKSMTGAKLQELKNAATGFLNKIHARLQGDPAAFKVAIVPFSEYVNVGMQYRNAPWIKVPQDRTITQNVQVCTRWVCTQWGRDESGIACIAGYHERLDQCYTETQTLTVQWEGCVGSRSYDRNLRDQDYDVERVPGVMTYKRNPLHPEDSIDGWHVWSRNDCGVPLTPLTTLKDNKDALVNSINNLQVVDKTYIPAGLVWGWRVLSGKEPFTQGTDDVTTKDRNVRKIIILMTDGANTLAPSTASWQWHADHYDSADPTVANRYTAELCNNIKAINPATGKPHAEIITITFAVNDPGIKSLMSSCSSLGSYDAASGDLASVFDSIAEKLISLHLSK